MKCDPGASSVRRTVRCALDARAALGECPVWNADQQSLYWIDILAPAVHYFRPADGMTHSWPLPEPIGSLGLCEAGEHGHADKAVLALKSGFAYLDFSSGALDPIDCLPESLPEGVRFNDGKVSPDGRFFAGTMDEQLHRRLGALYRLDPNGRCQRVLDGLIVSNGLAWSADGTTLYHSDSKGQVIDRWRYDAVSGTVSDRQPFARPDEAIGRPDGGATDIEGYYWSAGVSAGVINRWSPDGRLAERIAMPVPHPTCPCFGGANLKTLYVTSLRHTLDAAQRARYPLSGGIFSIEVDVPGVPVARFKALS